ncbi:4Fe-4S binding domain protein [[Eubacterium] yurii subsp. margaretiae ATCC 43715]|nr:4Fe-4S binding domain protein [[Eubacterium] yurii subsp. margaretiae ATCC 43715]
MIINIRFIFYTKNQLNSPKKYIKDMYLDFVSMLKKGAINMSDNIKIATIYFSATGTTKKVIDYIIKGIGGEVISSIDLTKRDNREKKQNLSFLDVDLIIIGAPIYGGFLYKEFRNYIKYLDFQGKYIIGITLYGNAARMFATKELISIIKKGNGRLLGYGEFVGEHSYSSKDIPVAKGRPNDDDLQTALIFGENIRKILLDKDNQHFYYKVSLFDKIISFIADIKPVHTGKGIFTIPYTDKEKCINCYKCVKICPKSCIDDKIMTNRDECIVCMACVKICPTCARISYPQNTIVKFGLNIINKRKHKSRFVVLK